MALRAKAVGQMFLQVLKQSVSRGLDRLAPSLGSLRHSSEIVSGQGKAGGGEGGSIPARGQSPGDLKKALEEKYLLEKQTRDVKELNQEIDRMREGRLRYHEKQRKRHMELLNHHMELLKKDNDPIHKVHISCHQESAKTHAEHIEKLKDEFKLDDK